MTRAICVGGALCILCACAAAPDAPPDAPASPDAASSGGEPEPAAVAQRLVAFADAHPEHPDYAAQALLRAASLYRDAADLDRERQLIERVIRGYPDTREHAWGLLLLSYSAHDRGEPEVESASLLALLCPDSGADPLVPRVVADVDLASCRPRDLPERSLAYAWLSLGQAYFDVLIPSETPSAGLDRAVFAFGRAAELAESDDVRTHAHYLRGWAFYRGDHCEQAMAELDLVAGTSGPEGLSAEAVQYIAICIAERDWDADGHDDAAWGLDRPEVQRWAATSAHVPEVLAQLVGALSDEQRCDEARRMRATLVQRTPERAAEADARLQRCH